MASDGESATANADVSEHVNNPIVFLILITLGVCALQRVGSWIAKSAGHDGAASFFGG